MTIEEARLIPQTTGRRMLWGYVERKRWEGRQIMTGAYGGKSAQNGSTASLAGLSAMGFGIRGANGD